MAEIAETEPEQTPKTPETNPSLANLAPPFTPANSREMQRRSAEARRAKKAKATQPTEQPLELPEYLALRLVRARKQIDQVSTMLEKERDAQKIDRLASALYRLSELERTLANRPLPGSLKPAPARRARSQASYGPIETASEPAQPLTEPPNGTP